MRVTTGTPAADADIRTHVSIVIKIVGINQINFIGQRIRKAWGEGAF